MKISRIREKNLEENQTLSQIFTKNSTWVAPVLKALSGILKI